MNTKILSANQLRSLYLKFFKEKGHAIISSASLIPENDPTVLFTTAGMHPLVPYILGERHAMGKRLTDVQKCIRTCDIDEVGDPSHLTFFEMMGNWSLGDYFKKETIAWSWEFLTSPEWLGLDKERLAFSVFEGDEDAPRDEEAADLWRQMGVAEDKIFYLPKENNWWGPAGLTGPCGPDTEMFLITDRPACSPECSPACNCGHYLEIWNDVFLQYDKQADGTYAPLAQKVVDTGMGVERTLCARLDVKSVYETELFAQIIGCIERLSGLKYGADERQTRSFRIIADHIRASTFIIGDDRGVTPSNADQGYVLRRLIRRAVRHGMGLSLPEGATSEIAKVIVDQYKDVYPELGRNEKSILEQFTLEEQRFQRTLKQGLREFEKVAGKLGDAETIDGVTAFRLYDTFGFPLEITVEMAAERGLVVDESGFAERFREHQEKSHAGAEQRFQGGLADTGEETAKLHTATHLMHAALRKVLGDEVAQRGSNITAERLRFDFSFPRKMTPEEIAEVQRLVNEYIRSGAEVLCEEMTVEEAKERGAIGLFESKYGERVKVYSMGGFSTEICGGPHAGNIGDLGSFTIQKEESSSAGVRRIKAVVGA